MKIFKHLFFIFFSVFILSTNVMAIDLSINNKKMELDVPPTIVEGRTLVPVRSIFEELGAEVKWIPKERQVEAIKGSTKILLTLDSNSAYVNNKLVILDVPPQIIDGRTLVPARFVAESLNAVVDWDSTAQIVKISTEKKAEEEFLVKRVVDGDTMVIDFNGKEERLRLIGVDTPESVHPDASKNVEEGKTASEYTKSLLEGKKIKLEFDVQERDRYGRLLGYAYIDGKMVNKILLEEGYAVLMTIPPNVKYVEDFKAIMGEETVEKPKNDSTVSGKVKYVASIKSDKYHNIDCQWSKKITKENLVELASISDAKAKGFTACGVCKPK